MKNTKLKWIAVLAVAATQTVSAAPITETVNIAGQEWAQVNLFTNTSWNTLNTQCPGSVCTATSTINGYDLAGWTWASNQTVQTMFNVFTGQFTLAPTFYLESNSTWAPKFLSYFFPTSTTVFLRRVWGLSSTDTEFDSSFAPRVDDYFTVIRPDETCSACYAHYKDLPNSNTGAWMVRDPASVPLPPTLTLFGLGLASLRISRRGFDKLKTKGQLNPFPSFKLPTYSNR